MSSSTRSRRSQEPPAEEKAKPLFTKRCWTGTGSVECSVWDKMIETDNGDVRVFNVIAKRSWKDGDKYESGNSFRPEDLLVLALFLQDCFAFINEEQGKK